MTSPRRLILTLALLTVLAGEASAGRQLGALLVGLIAALATLAGAGRIVGRGKARVR